VDDAPAAAEAWRSVLAASPGDVSAAFGLERTLGRQGSRDGLAAAHEVLATSGLAPEVRGVHALLAGHLYEAEGQVEAARANYLRALEVGSGGKAFQALRRLAVGSRDPAALAHLYQGLDPAQPQGLAGAQEEAELWSEAAESWRGVLAGLPAEDRVGRLSALLHLDCALSALEDWVGVHEVMGVWAQLSQDPTERATIEGRRRWLLREKLAGTDEAWQAYNDLHSQHPGDPEVLEALASIASARGLTEVAVGHLEGLAGVAADPVESARLYRQVAAARLAAGDNAGAQAAWLRALDRHPEDLESMSGLKELARGQSNWAALVGVLAREASVLEGDEALQRYREIASVWETRLKDSAVALDSWRKVLDLSPDDASALARVVELSRKTEDWTGFVENGQLLLRHLGVRERSHLQGEIGRIFLKHLYREDEALRFLDAATSGAEPDLEAAQLLERIHAARGAWDQVVNAILRQARAVDRAGSVPLLLRAAQTRLETLHDREGASEIYGKVLEADPANAEALRFRGDYLYQAGDLPGAVAVFAQAEAGERDRDLDDFDVKIEVALYYFRFAEALNRLGRVPEAVQRYSEALALNPGHLPSLEAVGPLYTRLGRWEKAEEVYRQVLQLTGGQGNPEKLARTYTSLGTVELNLGKLDNARKRFNKALELRQNDIRALQGIAAVLFARADWNNLLNIYNNIIYHAQEPAEVVDAYLAKGYVLDAKMELPDKAAQHFEKSLAFDPGQPNVLLRLAEIAVRRQDWPEAASLSERGLSQHIDDRRIEGGLMLVRAVAQAACGDGAAAKESFTEALRADATLVDAVGTEMGPWPSVASALKERLQSRL
jgi:tetratricopeptide (TPR) repeat protein